MGLNTPEPEELTSSRRQSLEEASQKSAGNRAGEQSKGKSDLHIPTPTAARLSRIQRRTDINIFLFNWNKLGFF